MATQIDTTGFQKTRYFARSWTLLTRDKGWVKPILILGLIKIVPIIGDMILTGFASEWARLIAWGADATPKQKGVDYGKCLSSGARGFLITLVWGFVVALIALALMFFPIIGTLISPFISLLAQFAAVLIIVAVVRAAIYQEMGAGFKISRIMDMVNRDSEGPLRITGMRIIFSLVTGMIAAAVMVGPTLAMVPSYTAQFEAMINSFTGTEEEMGRMIAELTAQSLLPLLPYVAVLGFIGNFVTVVVELLSFAGVGLWMRQFNVPAWGASDDPLPPESARYASYVSEYEAAAARAATAQEQLSLGAPGAAQAGQPAESAAPAPEPAPETAPAPAPEVTLVPVETPREEAPEAEADATPEPPAGE